MTKERETYSKYWCVSANHFYKNGAYQWMCKRIKHYKIVLEVGCGTGESTLSLLENKHRVISIEKNKYCIDKAKELVREKGFKIASDEASFKESDVLFINSDVYDEDLFNKLDNFSFNVVIAWCIGTEWGTAIEKYYGKI